jgi:hypothetical protein
MGKSLPDLQAVWQMTVNARPSCAQRRELTKTRKKQLVQEQKRPLRGRFLVTMERELSVCVIAKLVRLYDALATIQPVIMRPLVGNKGVHTLFCYSSRKSNSSTIRSSLRQSMQNLSKSVAS